MQGIKWIEKLLIASPNQQHHAKKAIEEIINKACEGMLDANSVNITPTDSLPYCIEALNPWLGSQFSEPLSSLFLPRVFIFGSSFFSLES